MEKCWFYSSCNHKDCENTFCIKKYKLDFLYTNSLLTTSQREKTRLYIEQNGTDYTEYTKLANIEKNIVSFVQDGTNLFIYSANPGTGKTSWAVRLIQAYLNIIWPGSDLVCRALFVSVPRLLIAIKENIVTKNDYATFVKENILEADLVVWDDIGAQLGTEFENNQLLSFIDSRIVAGKANVYTSNLNKAQLIATIGDRLTSRVFNLSTIIQFQGTDKRGVKIGGNN